MHKNLMNVLRAYADGKFKNDGKYQLEADHHYHLVGGAALGHLRQTYQQKQGLPQTQPTQIRKLDTAFASKVGKAYDEMPEYDEKALPAYSALMREVKAQHDHLTKAGYKYTLHYGDHEPYSDSDAMRADLHRNKHMHVFATASAFGGEPFQHHYDVNNKPLVDKPNPLLQHVPGMSTMEKPVLYNDLFRFVHDAFGHGIHPHQFGQLGEDNAYREHMTMFTPLAQRALTTETRGQNSWVNFGPHMKRPDGTQPKKGDADYVALADRRFADQKIALLPHWAMDLEKGEKGQGQAERKKSYGDGAANQKATPQMDDDADYGQNDDQPHFPHGFAKNPRAKK